jgi:SAM-dependent methyltransferase
MVEGLEQRVKRRRGPRSLKAGIKEAMSSRSFHAVPLALLVSGCGASPSAEPAAPSGASPVPSSMPSSHSHHAHDEAHAGHAHEGAHEPLVHRFEHAEEWAKTFDDPARDAWQRPAEVVALLQIRSGMSVVDIGAGTGYFVPYLARAVGPQGRVLALDVEPDMVRYLRERAAKEALSNVRAEVVEVDDPGLASESVDRILIVDTWHHIPDRVAYAKKLGKALSPGGTIAIVDFTMDAKNGPPPHHRLPPEEVVKELTRAGLEATIATEGLPEQYVVIARRPSP